MPVSANDIKKINQRLVQLRTTFGEDSIHVRKYVEAIEAVIPSQYLQDRKQDIKNASEGKIKKPLISISHSKKALENLDPWRINQLLKKPSAKQIIAEEKRVIAEERGIKPSSVKMSDVISYDKEKSDVLNWMNDNPSENYNALRYLMGIKKPTYADMKRAIKNFEREGHFSEKDKRKIRHRNQQINYRRKRN